MILFLLRQLAHLWTLAQFGILDLGKADLYKILRFIQLKWDIEEFLKKYPSRNCLSYNTTHQHKKTPLFLHVICHRLVPGNLLPWSYASKAFLPGRELFQWFCRVRMQSKIQKLEETTKIESYNRYIHMFSPVYTADSPISACLRFHPKGIISLF